MALSPCEQLNDPLIKIVDYKNASSVTVNSGSYATIVLTKPSGEDITGYTYIGIADVYSGNLRIPITRAYGSNSGCGVYVCNMSSNNYTIDANSCSLKAIFVKQQ